MSMRMCLLGLGCSVGLSAWAGDERPIDQVDALHVVVGQPYETLLLYPTFGRARFASRGGPESWLLTPEGRLSVHPDEEEVGHYSISVRVWGGEGEVYTRGVELEISRAEADDAREPLDSTVDPSAPASPSSGPAPDRLARVVGQLEARGVADRVIAQLEASAERLKSAYSRVADRLDSAPYRRPRVRPLTALKRSLYVGFGAAGALSPVGQGWQAVGRSSPYQASQAFTLGLDTSRPFGFFAGIERAVQLSYVRPDSRGQQWFASQPSFGVMLGADWGSPSLRVGLYTVGGYWYYGVGARFKWETVVRSLSAPIGVEARLFAANLPATNLQATLFLTVGFGH